MNNYSRFITTLFVVVILKQLLWIAFVPLWQYPDEQAHFGQVQNIAEKRPTSVSGMGNTSKEIYESEKLLGTLRDPQGNNNYTFHPEYNIPYSSTTAGIYEKTIMQFPHAMRETLIINEATSYPLLYYQLSALFYNLAKESDLLTLVFTARLVNLLIFFVILIVTVKMSNLIFKNSFSGRILFITLVVFHPMFSFVAGGINSDNLFALIFNSGILLVVMIIKSGWSIKKSIFLIILSYLGIVTKPQGYLLPLIFLLPAMKTFWQKKSNPMYIGIFLVGLVILFYQPLVRMLTHQQFIPEIIAIDGLHGISLSNYIHFLSDSIIHFYREAMPWYWGVFRWLSLTYPRPVHRIINVIILISLIGIGKFFLDKNPQRLGAFPSRLIVLFLMFVSGFYFIGLTTFNYLFYVSHGYLLGIQGRYFFPTILAHMALVTIGIMSVIPRHMKKVILNRFAIS